MTIARHRDRGVPWITSKPRVYKDLDELLDGEPPGNWHKYEGLFYFERGRWHEESWDMQYWHGVDD